MPNNSALIAKLLAGGVPLRKGKKDLHRVLVWGKKALDAWWKKHGRDTFVAAFMTKVDGEVHLDALVYMEAA